MNYQDIISALRNDPNFDEAKIKEVLNFVIKNHRDNNHQFIEIAKTITSVYPDTSSTITALLFFSYAKDNLKTAKIQCFNTEISKIFNALTKLFQSYNIYFYNTTQEIFKLLLSLEPDIGIRILLIRFVYLLNQIIFDSKVSDIEYYLTSSEISKLYVPLFQEITIEYIKTALQDNCLRILQPQLQELIVTSLTEQYPNQQQLVISTINTLHDILSVLDIAYTISGRVKSCYSIAKKIVQKSCKVTELFDIIGIRVIVEEEDQCYKILDTIYNNYKHIPRRYKDFIKFPKKSGYQSLHTVIVKDSQKIEVQIRTKMMHHVALFGSASHLQYKMPSIRNNVTLHSLYDLLNKYILDILNPFTINIRLKAVRIANESVALRSEVTWLITQDIEVSQLHYRFSYQEHDTYYVVEVITVNVIEVNELFRQLVNIDDKIDINAARTSQIQEQYLANIRTNYQDHNQQYAEILLTDLSLDNMDNDYRANQSVQNAKKSNTLGVIKNNITIIPNLSIELLKKLFPPYLSQEKLITHYQDSDWYAKLISLKSKTSYTNAQNDCSVSISIIPLSKRAYAEEFVGDASPRTPACSNVREEQSTGITHKLPAEVEFRKRSIEDFLQIASARELKGDTERKITTYIDVAENLCPASKTKLSAAIDLPKISIILPTKVSYVQEFERNFLSQTTVSSGVCEDLSIISFDDQNNYVPNKHSIGILIKIFSSIIQKHPIVINIRDKKIKNLDIKTIIFILKDHNITELTIDTNIFRIKDTKITHLNLGNNNTSDKEFETFISLIKDTKITHLNLGNNNISDKEFKMLVSLLKDTKITHLNLEHNYISMTEIEMPASLLKDTKITHLNLQSNQIEEDCAKLLVSILKDTQIIYLNLLNNNIGSTSIESVSNDTLSLLQATKITCLDLGYNKISDTEIKSLVSILKNTQIIDINLEENYIGNSGAIELASALKDTKLAKLNLAYNSIGNSGAIELASALKDTKLAKLNLAYNSIGNAGAIELASALKDTKITELILDYNTIDDTGINVLISIKENTKIIISFTVQNKNNIYNAQQLETQKFPYTDGNDDRNSESRYDSGCGMYEELDTIKVSSYIYILQKYPSITHLSFQDNCIDNSNIKKLANVLPNTNIKYLNLNNNKISYEGFKTLVSILKKTSITHLVLKHNCINTFVQKNSNRIGDCKDNIEQLTNMLEGSKIKDNNFYITVLNFIYESIEDEELNLACNRIGDCKDNIKQLANMLEKIKIKHLDLENNADNNFYITVLNFIYESIEDEELNLACNRMGDCKDNICKNNIKQLANMLEKIKIKHLDLENNADNNFDITALNFIYQYIEVEELNLACNRIGDCKDNIKQLANMLEKIKIKHLDLQNNLIDNSDIETLVNVLPDTNITHLNLNDNAITTQGAKILINELNNTKIIKLDFKHNYIGKDIVADQKSGGCQIDFDDQNAIYDNDFYPGSFPKLQNITYSLQDRIEDNISPIHQVADYNLPNSELSGDTSYEATQLV